jgi:CheY-like chemotaxis protein
MSDPAMPGYRILVVDDSRLVHDLVRIAFEARPGWTLLHADSGAEALARVNSGQPDALLLDVEMPDLDGPATLAALRAAGGAAAATPVVFLTGHDEPSERARLEALEPAGVIGKPFELEQLADQLAGLLGWTR